MDKIRVLRVIEYVGPRDRVEEVVAASIHGSKDAGRGLTINAATIGAYPEILPVDDVMAELIAADVEFDRATNAMHEAKIAGNELPSDDPIITEFWQASERRDKAISRCRQ